MQSAPFPVISSAGLVTWTNPATPPTQWEMEIRLYDGSTSVFFTSQITLAGTAMSFDAYGNGWPGGCRVVLIGLDADGNVSFAPTLSNTLTKDL